MKQLARSNMLHGVGQGGNHHGGRQDGASGSDSRLRAALVLHGKIGSIDRGQ